MNAVLARPAMSFVRSLMLGMGMLDLLAGGLLITSPAALIVWAGWLSPDPAALALARWIGGFYATLGIAYLSARNSHQGEFQKAAMEFATLFQLTISMAGCVATTQADLPRVWELVAGCHLALAFVQCFLVRDALPKTVVRTWTAMCRQAACIFENTKNWAGGITDDFDSTTQASLDYARRLVLVLGCSNIVVGTAVIFSPSPWLTLAGVPMNGTVDVWLLRWAGGFYSAVGAAYLLGLGRGKVGALRVTMEITGLFQLVTGVLGLAAAKIGVLPSIWTGVALVHLTIGLIQGWLLFNEDWADE